MGNDKEELVYELVLKHGSQVELSVKTWILFVFIIASNGVSNKMTATLSEGNRFLLLLLVRVVSIKKAHKWSIQVL
ncbi:hypothetical protein MKW92_027851, partial [Papaver armeniacum]